MAKHIENPFGAVGKARRQKAGPPGANVPTRSGVSAAQRFSNQKRARAVTARRKAAARKHRKRGLKSGGR